MATPRRQTTGRRSSPSAPDAITLLKRDHAEVDRLFKRFESATTRQKPAIVERIRRELTVHMQIEEEILYPAAREALPKRDARELVPEAEVEHNSGRDLMAKIEAATPGTEEYDALVKVMGEYIKHHVEEEHDELFPKLRKSGVDLKALGRALAERKAELLGAARAAA
jgi:iron-sulfur cluster repair protein YtfE (RIC family)